MDQHQFYRMNGSAYNHGSSTSPTDYEFSPSYYSRFNDFVGQSRDSKPFNSSQPHPYSYNHGHFTQLWNGSPFYSNYPLPGHITNTKGKTESVDTYSVQNRTDMVGYSSKWYKTAGFRTDGCYLSRDTDTRSRSVDVIDKSGEDLDSHEEAAAVSEDSNTPQSGRLLHRKWSQSHKIKIRTTVDTFFKISRESNKNMFRIL